MDIQITLLDGSLKSVEAHGSCGDFAVTPALTTAGRQEGWIITHVPSGTMICAGGGGKHSKHTYSWRTAAGALAFAERLQNELRPGDVVQDADGIWRVSQRFYNACCRLLKQHVWGR